MNDLADRALRPPTGTLAPVPDRGEPLAPQPRTPARTVETAGKARILGLEAGPSGPEPVPALPEPGAAPLLDAETIADLVNEALVEQARRHGVDLS